MSSANKPELMLQQSHALVLETIKQHEPISRIELANRLGLNPATITRITRVLLEQHLITAEGEGETSGAGRKPVLLHYNHTARLVMGIIISHRQITGIVADQAAHSHARHTSLLPAQPDSEFMQTFVQDLLRANLSFRQRLVTLTIGASNPALITPEIVQSLETQFGLPVIVMDETKLMTLAESRAGAMRQQVSFALLSLGKQSHFCLHLNGKMRVGGLGLTLDGDPLSERVCDAGLLAEYDGPATSARQIFELVRQGDSAAKQAVYAIVCDLAYAMTWMSNLLMLDTIVLAGSWFRAMDVLMPMLQNELAEYSHAPQLVPAQWGDEASLMGAVYAGIPLSENT